MHGWKQLALVAPLWSWPGVFAEARSAACEAAVGSSRVFRRPNSAVDPTAATEPKVKGSHPAGSRRSGCGESAQMAGCSTPIGRRP